jgi:GDP-mannose 6-dehydrogenase
MNLSIFGLGYVGSVTAGCLAKIGHSVIGTDIKTEKVESINNGEPPMFERGLDILIKSGVESGRLRATTSVNEAVEHSDCAMICVGTPSNSDGSINLEHIERVCIDIGSALKTKRSYFLIVIRSTLIPNVTEDVLIPILEESSGKKIRKDFSVCFNPEFLREGQAIDDFFNPGRIVIGEFDRRAGELVKKIYSGVDAPVVNVKIKTAEMVKYAFNSFHGLKVAFANEIGALCKKNGIDGREVMEIFCMDKKLNLSPYYLKPGFAFGGSCIPKDLRAILHQSRDSDINLPLIGSVLSSNEEHIERAVELLIEQKKRKITFLGLTFKSGTEDIRESPTIPLITKLLEKGYLKLFEKGYEVRIYDPMANISEIKSTLPHIYPLLKKSFEECIKNSEVVVLTKNEEEFKKIPLLMSKNQILIDLVGLFESNDLKGRYVGICW